MSVIQNILNPTRNSESARRNAPDSVHGGEIRDIKCKTGQPSAHHRQTSIPIIHIGLFPRDDYTQSTVHLRLALPPPQLPNLASPSAPPPPLTLDSPTSPHPSQGTHPRPPPHPTWTRPPSSPITHLELVLLLLLITLSLAARLRVQEAPAAVLEEALRIVHDRLHDLGPVERLHALRVADVTRAGIERSLSVRKLGWPPQSTEAGIASSQVVKNKILIMGVNPSMLSAQNSPRVKLCVRGY